ncbi:MAG: GNAT family N-acetyltransferase [Anaerolineaceae bacterium]|nr:GNAT family N-acetyltransferase [Anaerolineaceae bacterium]
MTEVNIRAMRPADVAFAAHCTAAVEWASEDRAVFDMFYAHDPTGCLLAELDGKPAGICIASAFARAGFIGELIVLEEFRGQGIGAALMTAAINNLQARGLRSIYLDGVLKAVPLYERLGFRKVCRSWRFSGQLAGVDHPHVRPMQPEDLPAVLAVDAAAWGDDRSFFLRQRYQRFPRLCKVMFEERRLAGYIMGRGIIGQGDAGGWVGAGPWAMACPEYDSLPLLVELAAEAKPGDLFTCGVLDSNPQAVQAMEALGLQTRDTSPWRMLLGEDIGLGASPLCWAVGSAAKG